MLMMLLLLVTRRRAFMTLRHFFKTPFELRAWANFDTSWVLRVVQPKEGISLSQRKYVFDILEVTGLLSSKPVKSPMDPNVKLYVDQGELLSYPERYCMVGK
jgi:hypothetical protein